MNKDFLSNVFIETQKLEWEILSDTIKRKIVAYNEDVMMVLVHFKKGGVGELHQHFHTQVSYIQSGVFEVEIDSTKKTLSAGDVFFVQPNLLHGVVCIEEGVLVDVFNPKREDFLNKK